MNRKLTLASIVLCLISASASAQGFSENFLLEGVRTSFRFNPAATGSDPFLSLGSYAGTSAANIGASSILFPDAVEGSVVTGLHSAIPADTFLGGLKDKNILTGNMDYNLFAYGFSHGGHFHIVEVSLKNDYRTALSKNLFSLLKIGSRTEAYDLGGTGERPPLCRDSLRLLEEARRPPHHRRERQASGGPCRRILQRIVA